MRIVRRRRRSPWALGRGNLCSVTGQASNRTRASSETKRGAPDSVVDGAVPPSSCRLPSRNVSGWRARVFSPGCGPLQSAFEEQERGQKKMASAGYHHRDPTRMWYRCDSLSGPDPGGTLAIDLKDGNHFFCSYDKIYRLGGSRPCVFVSVGCASSSPSWPSSGFKQPHAVMKGCLQCLKEWLFSWQLRQRPRFSRRASARGERRPLPRGGSSVISESITTKPSAQ